MAEKMSRTSISGSQITEKWVKASFLPLYIVPIQLRFIRISNIIASFRQLIWEFIEITTIFEKSLLNFMSVQIYCYNLDLTRDFSQEDKHIYFMKSKY